MKEDILSANPIEVKKTYPYRIGVFSDMHVGSIFAITNNPITSHQKKLLEAWNSYIDFCNEWKINHAWIVGDLILGNDFRSRGRFTSIPFIPNQIRAVSELLIDFANKVPSLNGIYIWGGTPYHDSEDTLIEETVVDKLNSAGVKATYKGEYTILTLKYNNLKKKLFITHPTSASSRPENALGRIMSEWQEKVGQGKLPPIDMIVSAHKHEYVEVHKTSIRALQLPAWQLFTPYDSALKYFAKYQPDIGGTVITYDDHMRSHPMHYTFPSFVPESYQTEIKIVQNIKKEYIDKKHKKEIDRLR